MLWSQSLKGVKRGGDCQSWETWNGAYEQAFQNIRGITKSLWRAINSKLAFYKSEIKRSIKVFY